MGALQQSTSAGPREGLPERVSAALDVILAILAIVFLGLIVAELALQLSPAWQEAARAAGLAIWAVFVAAFLVELGLARSRLRYLKANWLVALSLALPMLRVFRIFRAVRVLRGFTLARALSGLNRASHVLRQFAASSQFLYLLVLTIAVTLVAAAIGYSFEEGSDESALTSYGEALWWAATLVTTVNAQSEAVTAEGRVVAMLLRVYGIAVIGYLTAQIAVFLLGGRRPEPVGERTAVEELRREVERLADLIEAERSAAGRERRPPTRDAPIGRR